MEKLKGLGEKGGTCTGKGSNLSDDMPATLMYTCGELLLTACDVRCDTKCTFCSHKVAPIGQIPTVGCVSLEDTVHWKVTSTETQ